MAVLGGGSSSFSRDTLPSPLRFGLAFSLHFGPSPRAPDVDVCGGNGGAEKQRVWILSRLLELVRYPSIHADSGIYLDCLLGSLLSLHQDHSLHHTLSGPEREGLHHLLPLQDHEAAAAHSH